MVVSIRIFFFFFTTLAREIKKRGIKKEGARAPRQFPNFLSSGNWSGEASRVHWQKIVSNRHTNDLKWIESAPKVNRASNVSPVGTRGW